MNKVSLTTEVNPSYWRDLYLLHFYFPHPFFFSMEIWMQWNLPSNSLALCKRSNHAAQQGDAVLFLRHPIRPTTHRNVKYGSNSLHRYKKHVWEMASDGKFCPGKWWCTATNQTQKEKLFADNLISTSLLYTCNISCSWMGQCIVWWVVPTCGALPLLSAAAVTGSVFSWCRTEQICCNWVLGRT